MYENKLIQKSFREFVQAQTWYMPHAVTLTMKQGRQVDGGLGMGYQPLTPNDASVNMRHFLNRLDRQTFGNAGKRNGKRVQAIPVLEGGEGVHLHYHLVLDCPRDELRSGYTDLISRLWLTTDWGHKRLLIHADSDDGWTKYISKLRSKSQYRDSIDWTNCYVLNR